jgi:hypothetical protein
MTSDGYGRLKTRHMPEQQVDPNNSASTDHTTYAYNPDDTIHSVTDARGASATYSYNGRSLVTGIVYAAPSGSSISVPTAVSYGYDAAGNRSSMTDAVGNMSYQYDQLSRLQVETRSFSDLTGSYPLTYNYNLAGESTSIAEPSQFGAVVSYVYDTAGKMTSITGSGFGATTQFATGIQYRAWGATKHVDYGNGAQLNVTYNQRLLSSRYEVSNVIPSSIYPPPPPTSMGSNNQYFADGRISYAQDLQNGSFDRAYQYDNVGSIKEGYSGREARGLPASSPPDSPFRQTYTYDAWQNLARTGRHWSVPKTDTPAYTNNRRSDWTYDAEGNVTWRPKAKVHTYDAADQEITFYEENLSGPPQAWVDEEDTISQTYDGGGLPGKRVETRHIRDYQGSDDTEVTTTYYLRSSVLGGAAIAEVDQYGWRQKGSIYAGSQKLAELAAPYPGYNFVTWRHVNPTTGSWLTTDQSRNASRTELDPLGADVGTSDPYITYQTYSEIMGPASLYSERGNAFDSGGGCAMDGMPISCSWFRFLMDGGAVATESVVREASMKSQPPQLHPHQQYSDEFLWKFETRDIDSFGLGLFLAQVPTEMNTEEYDPIWEDRLVTVPQNSSTGTSLRAKTSYVDQQVLNSCTEDYFGVTLKSFDESRRGQNGRFTGTGPSYLPGNPNGEGGTATYTITNSVDYSNKELQKMATEWFGGRPPEPGKKLVGFELPGYPLRNYTGSDNGPMQMIMTQVHELGHSLDEITQIGYDNINRHPGRPDLGGQILEDCVRKRGGFKWR